MPAMEATFAVAGSVGIAVAVGISTERFAIASGAKDRTYPSLFHRSFIDVHPQGAHQWIEYSGERTYEVWCLGERVANTMLDQAVTATEQIIITRNKPDKRRAADQNKMEKVLAHHVSDLAQAVDLSQKYQSLLENVS